MSSTIHSLTDRTQKDLAFQQWLSDISPRLKQSTAALLSPAQQAEWLALLNTAGTRQEIFPILVKLRLPLAVIAQLFEKTSALLPEHNPDYWRHLSQLQTQIMRVLGEASNVSTHHQRIGMLSKLPGLVQDFASSNQMLETIASLLSEIFYNASINIFLSHAAIGTLSLKVANWQGPTPTEADKASFARTATGSTGAVKSALMSRTPQIAHAVSYPLPQKLPAVREELAAPMVKDGNVLGIIHVLNHGSQPYTLTDLSFLDAVASELTLMLDSADMQSILAHQTKEKQILLEANAALSSSDMGNTAIKTLAAKITEALAVGACVISRWNDAAQTFTAVAEYVAESPATARRTWRNLQHPIPIADDPIGKQVWYTREPFSQRSTTPRYTAPLTRNNWRRYGWNSVLAVPIINQSQFIGLLEVYDHSMQRTFSTDEIQLMQAFAHQTSIIFNQLDLLQATQQRLMEVSTLYSLSREIISTSPLKLNTLLDNIVSTVKQIVDCRACVLFLLDDSGKYLEIKAATGIKKQWKDRARLAVGEGAAGTAVAERRTVYVPDTLADPDFIFFDHSIRSLVVVPLIFQEEVIGAINLDDTKPNAFGEAQEKLLSIAANHAAIAIQNARLFQKLSTEEHRTRAIIEHMADGILLINRDGSIITVNSALSRMVGIRSGAMLGKNIHSTNLHPALKAISAPLQRDRHTGHLASTVTLPGETGTTLRIIATPVTNERGQLLGEVRLLHDITRERHLEQLKDDFISTISHELRTPLFSIQGFVRLILNGDVPDEKTQREFLTIIERQADHLAELVSNLLDLNRISSNALQLNLEPVDLNDILAQTIRQLQGFSRKKKVQVGIKLPASLPLIQGDATRLRQVFTNLIGNAIKFTPQNGRVFVQAKAHNNSVLISVTDTGIGIPAEELERIFGKFYQVEEHSTRSAEGSGLGLHIARQLVERHHGKIWAQSELGKGSTFFVQLPIAANQQLTRRSVTHEHHPSN